VNSRVPITILEVRPQKEATNAGVRQDKSDLIRDRAASDQPYRTPDEIRSNHSYVHSPQSDTPASQRSNTIGHQPASIDPKESDGPLVPITIQIPKLMKAEIQRIAAQEGESDSATARAFLGRGLQANIDMQYGAMLRPVIQDQIHKDMQSYSNRTANIGLQAYYAAEQARILAIHTIRFLTDLVNSSNDDPINSPDELPLILKVAQEEAWKNMTKLNSDKSAAPQRKEKNREWQS
jgi:hypothetical protein